MDWRSGILSLCAGTQRVSPYRKKFIKINLGISNKNETIHHLGICYILLESRLTSQSEVLDLTSSLFPSANEASKVIRLITGNSW